MVDPVQFKPLIGNKSSGAIFGTFICRFLISPALSEQNVPLPCAMHAVTYVCTVSEEHFIAL